MTNGRLCFVVAVAAALLMAAALPAASGAAEPATEDIQGPAGTETLADEGRWHLDPGERWHYDSAPPTSGPHDPKWVKPGFYRTPQPPEKLVHSLEHGNVIIYYDRPPAAVRSQLQQWAKRHPGKWDGVIVTPLSGLGQGVVLTAWRKRLRLAPFDRVRGQAFLEAFLGQGPESGERDM